MSCCSQCSSLGGMDDEETANTSSSREQIESHHEIHRRQLKFIETPLGDSIIEVNQSAKESSSKTTKDGEAGERNLDMKSNESIHQHPILDQTVHRENKLSTGNDASDLIVEGGSKDNGLGTSQTSKRASVIAHCRSLLKPRPPDTDRTVHCNICKVPFAVYQRTGRLNVTAAIWHAQLHLDGFVYSCRQCAFESNKLYDIRAHLEKEHQISWVSATNHYVDKGEEFAHEIKGSITSCFGKSEKSKSSSTVESKKVKKQLRKQKVARRKSHAGQTKLPCRDKLARIRQDYCYRLIRNVWKTGLIMCRKCYKTIHCHFRKYDAPHELRHHVCRKHFSKPLYRCRLCRHELQSYDQMTCHFKKHHNGESRIGNYENNENDFHDEIMRELSACFDTSGSASAGGGASKNGSYRSRKIDKTKRKTSSKRKGKGVLVQDGKNKRIRLDDKGDRSAAIDASHSKPTEDGADNQQDISPAAPPLSRRKIHRCPVCERSFGHQFVLKKHMEVFHSG